MIKGKTIFLRLLTIDDAHALHVLENGNRDFFEQFSQERNKDFYTIESQLKRTKRYEEESQNDLSYNFGIFIDENILVGTINLFQVLRGSLQSAFIGYFLDKNHTGKAILLKLLI